MKLHSLEIKNFRCFDHIEVSFHPTLTVLVAPNGGGKSATLDAIAMSLSPFVEASGVAAGRHMDSGDSYRKLVPIKGGEPRATMFAPFQEIRLTASASYFDNHLHWTLEKTSEQGLTEYIGIKGLAGLMAKLTRMLATNDAPDVILPIVAQYGTSRLWGDRQLKFQEDYKATQPRPHGYKECLDSTSRYESFAGWFSAACFRVLAGRIQALDTKIVPEEQAYFESALNNVRDAVRTVLAPYGNCWLDYLSSIEAIGILDTDRDTALGLDQLSDGVQTIVGLVGDIASRTSILNPQFGSEAAAKTPGVVLIDEVDMHLHPTWQQVILHSLGEIFPSVQFIVTTHSPQVLTTVPKENIRVIQTDSEGKWTALPPAMSPLAKESGDALALIMGTHPRPNVRDVLTDVHAYEKLARAGQSESADAKRIRERLNAAGFEFSDAEESLFTFLNKKALDAENQK